MGCPLNGKEKDEMGEEGYWRPTNAGFYYFWNIPSKTTHVPRDEPCENGEDKRSRTGR